MRGGGHNVGGLAVADGAVMIDLAEMKGVDVDPETGVRRRAKGGVTWGELNDAAAEHGLAVTGGAISTTGIAGFTLGRRPRLAHGEVRARGRQPALRSSSSPPTARSST